MFSFKHHRPLAAHPVISSVCFILLLAAFILLLLVAISLPIVKAVYLLSINTLTDNLPPNAVATQLRFGVWGACLNRFTQRAGAPLTTETCYGPRLGYDVPDELGALVGISPLLLNVIEQSLLVVLVLHPIAAIFALIGFIISLFLKSHAMAILNLIISTLTVLLTTVVLAIDLSLVLVARNKMEDIGNFPFTVEWGIGIWMVLVATICTWLSVLFISARVCYCCGVRKYEKKY